MISCDFTCWLLFEGTVDEPAIVEVDVNSDGYQRAAVLSNPGGGNYLFRREVGVNQGLNTMGLYWRVYI